MKVTVELYPQRRLKSVRLKAGCDGFGLLRELGLAPDVHIIVRRGSPIPADEGLVDGERIRIIAVVSGG